MLQGYFHAEASFWLVMTSDLRDLRLHRKRLEVFLRQKLRATGNVTLTERVCVSQMEKGRWSSEQ